MMTNYKEGSYWMLTTTKECPDCGKSRTTRQRIYSPKPLTDRERFEWLPMKGCPCIY